MKVGNEERRGRIGAKRKKGGKKGSLGIIVTVVRWKSWLGCKKYHILLGREGLGDVGRWTGRRKP